MGKKEILGLVGIITASILVAAATVYCVIFIVQTHEIAVNANAGVTEIVNYINANKASSTATTGSVDASGSSTTSK